MTEEEVRQFVYQRIRFITHNDVSQAPDSTVLGHGGAGMDAVAIEGMVERSNNYVRAHGGRETIGDDDGVGEKTTLGELIELIWKKVKS
ncbi:MAG: hypothetical protein DME97_08530 [Verrucomicrobia bacterium]|nr:MAG: hypothetical protein DME97_08530 [Verrucomicrobiota bacterium]